MKTPILGGESMARSVNAACNRMVNLYSEMVPEGGKEPAFLSRCPGLLLKQTIGAGPIRGMWKFGNYGYAVSGGELYQFDGEYSATKIGDVSGSGNVSMSDNGVQLFISCNPDGYIYNSTTGVFGKIADPDFQGSGSVGYLDGYFVFNQPDTGMFWVTSLLDGTAIDPLEFASSEGNPDNIVALAVDHREVWLFGTDTVEVFYNSGAVNFPLDRISGAFIEAGCLAPYSIAKLDNSLIWLGSDSRGRGLIFRVNGYTPIRISTHTVESAIQGYTVVDDAIAYSYQANGHSFYVLTFPTENTTWCFDVATGLWHERASFENGSFIRHRGNCFLHFGRDLLVGDFQNGNIYALDDDTYSDNLQPSKWLRSWRALPTSMNDLSRKTFSKLQIDCETGIGLPDGQGSDPTIMLRWSDDGGHTWSNEHHLYMGATGETKARVIKWQMGISRDRVFEISGTDPVKIAIVGAELTVAG